MKYFVLLSLLLSLTACGVKPGQLDTPKGGDDTFPRTYPSNQ